MEEPAKPIESFESPLRFHHIGIVVKDLGAGRVFFEAALAVHRWTPVIEDEGIGVNVQFGSADDGVTYELIAPRHEQSPVSKALREGTHTVHHLAYRTDDLARAGDALRAQGCWPTGEARAAAAYGGRKVQFFLSPLHLLIELIAWADGRA